MATVALTAGRVPLINIERDASLNGEPYMLGQRCHKKCPAHSRRRCHRRLVNLVDNGASHTGGATVGYHKMPTGDEHWTKVLQANTNIAERMLSCPYHGRNPVISYESGWVKDRGRMRRSTTVTSAFSDHSRSSSASPTRAKFLYRKQFSVSAVDHVVGSPVNSDSIASGSEISSSKNRSSTTSSSSSVFQTLFDRFCRWLDDTRRDSHSILHRVALPRRPSQLLPMPTADSWSAESSTSSRGRGRTSCLLSPDDSRYRQHHRHQSKHRRRHRHKSKSRNSSSDGGSSVSVGATSGQLRGVCVRRGRLNSRSSSKISSSSERCMLPDGGGSGTTSDGWTSGGGYRGLEADGDGIESPWATSGGSTCSSMATFSSTSTALSDYSPTLEDGIGTSPCRALVSIYRGEPEVAGECNGVTTKHSPDPVASAVAVANSPRIFDDVIGRSSSRRLLRSSTTVAASDEECSDGGEWTICFEDGRGGKGDKGDRGGIAVELTDSTCEGIATHMIATELDDTSSGIHVDFKDSSECSPSEILDAGVDESRSRTRLLSDGQLRDSLTDWTITYSSLQLTDLIKVGDRCTIYRGRWHGDVRIHIYSNRTDAEMSEFLLEASCLSRVRHENICLFMAACLDPPSQAIVTSALKGSSVYERLLQHDRPALPLRSRVHIARQVAQAINYLHAKSIVARCSLTSRSIYLEPKVKLSLLDHVITDGGTVNNSEHFRVSQLCLPRGTISYLAPEVLRTLRPTSYHTVSSIYHFDRSTDVFAFGTLMYELISCEFPWRGLRSEEIIWNVVSGKRQSLSNLRCNSVLRTLIERCWSHGSLDRPHSADINKELQNKTGLHKRHSSSQPARLDRYGTNTSRTFCIK